MCGKLRDEGKQEKPEQHQVNVEERDDKKTLNEDKFPFDTEQGREKRVRPYVKKEEGKQHEVHQNKDQKVSNHLWLWK